jgi:ferredoxin-NADP reductase
VTAPQLLAYICSAIAFQLLVGGAIAFWRYRRQPSRPGISAPVATQVAGTNAWTGLRDFRVTHRAYEDAAQTQCSFYLAPIDGRPLDAFKPGQFLTLALQLPGDPTAAMATAGTGATITRCYSLSDAPSPQTYRITVKRVPAPAGRQDLPAGLGSNYLHEHIQTGDLIRLRAPAGHFHIDADGDMPAVLVAGGIGITPMMSMLRWCLAAQPGRRVHLYYGVRNSTEQAFKALLEALAAAHPTFTLQVVYSRPHATDQLGRDYQHVGHVDIDLLRRSLPHGRHQFYLCGPGTMMKSLVPALRDWGVQDGDLHHEAFGPASVQPATPAVGSAGLAAPAVVRLERSGRTLDWSGQDGNLLDFAERHGQMVESGCRAGSCGACQTRLISGSVAYAERPDHDIAPGHCLLCVGRPASDIVLEL